MIQHNIVQVSQQRIEAEMDMFKIENHEIIFKASCKITSPLAPTNQVYYCVSQNGDIYKLEQTQSSAHKQSSVLFTILGCPSAIDICEGNNKGFLISDLAHQSIFLRDDEQVEQINNLITQFNERAFHGPSSIALDESNSQMFFTDSGSFGQTSIENKVGSLFCYNFQDKSIRSLIYRELAYPCSVIISPNQKYLLVCELGQNRIIKVVLESGFAGNYTVFHQFSGRVGPSSICYYNGYYFVSLFEFAQLDNTGIIAVLNEQGQLIQKISLPTGPQITSIKFVPPGNNSTYQMQFLATEGNRLHQIKFRGEKVDLQSESDGMIDVSGLHNKSGFNKK